MKRFLGFLKKEFYHIFRDKRTLLILFGMPVAQILLFGFAITNEIKSAKIGIYDQSHDFITQKITSKLLSSGYFILEETINNQGSIQRAFEKGKIKEVVIFEPDFAKKLSKTASANIQLLADATDPNTANALVSYTTAIINEYRQSLNINKQSAMVIIPEVKMMFNPELKGVFMFVPGVITIILMLVSAMMTSISIAREKELGTMEVLMVSPLRPLPIILGKVIPYLILSFINASVILLLGRYIFNMPMQGNIFLLLFECLLFIITALSLGILISTISKTQQTAMMISMMGLMLPTIMLSGFIFPIESMPLPLRIISNVIPARWFIHLIKDIMLKGNGINYVWKETLVLLGMTCFFIGISMRKFKLRLE